MNKLLISAILLASCNIHANPSNFDNFNRIIEQDRIKTMTSEGFNPGGGVTVVDDEAIKLTDGMKSQWDKERKEYSKKGYYEMYSPRALELLDYAEHIQEKYDLSDKTDNRDSSVLRRNMDEINFAYNITPVLSDIAVKTYGFAGVNTFHKGWTGFVQYFESSLGNCAFTENNVKLTHQAAKIQRSMARYDVNKKVTTVMISGNGDSGYLYEVDWFDDSYFSILECATKHYSQLTSDKVLKMASEIDIK